ncbi:transmembrane protein [Achlya hypogyna]|uniref:Transmembrane protein n=1 Tax=Achlya hypogyna TaxID=1202772 RepID=A0A1V9YF12_ACHHY|nr:transmembrane protein [Achlya hypogyna]
MRLAVLAAALPLVAGSTSLCATQQFSALPLQSLGNGPLHYKSLASADRICIQVALADAQATWLGLAVSPTTAMVNDQVNSAVVFNFAADDAALYELAGFEPELLVLAPNASASISVYSRSVVDGSAQVTFERPLEAVAKTDVSIDLATKSLLNWAYGHDAWPSYHHDRGSAAVSLGTHQLNASPTGLCASPEFDALPLQTLGKGPVRFKSLADDLRVCVHVELHDTAATWLGISFSNSTAMVNDPVNNAVVFDVRTPRQPELYALSGYDPEDIVRLDSQSPIAVYAASAVDGVVQFTVERSLAAVAPSDVALAVGNSVLNWAYGHDAWPSYHHDRGSAQVSIAARSAAPASLCASRWFQHGLPLRTLDPTGALQIRRLLHNGQACVQLVVTDPKATWFGLSFAPKAVMVNDPTNNALIFDLSTTQPQLYALGGYEPEDIQRLRLQDIPSYVLYSASIGNGSAQFTFQRSLVGATPTDVAIEPDADTVVNWAYGRDAWPSYHHDRGSALLAFHSLQLTSTTSTAAAAAPTGVIVLAFLAWIALLGAVSTHALGYDWRRVVNRAVIAPPRYRRDAAVFETWVLQPLSDLKLGEAIVLGHYALCLVVVGAAVAGAFDASRRWSLVSGHLALVHLALILLPVARGLYWEVAVFGTSFERVLKFHRVLGRLFVLFATWHLVLNAQRISVLSAAPFGSQEVIPVFGFAAFVSFAILGLFALSVVRRNYFEVFYYVHRIAAVGGIVFAGLHARTVWTTLLFPATVYILSYVVRLGAHFNRFTVAMESYADKTVSFVLPSTSQTQAWAREMPLGAYFWVSVPSVSVLQWHPFSAMATATPDGKPTIGFVAKAATDGSFVDAVVQKHVGHTTTVVVGGPYGNLSVRLADYSNVVLIAGGIGITPLLHIFNQPPARPNATTVLHWIARDPAEFLAPSAFLRFPSGAAARLHLYADEVSQGGRVIVHDDLVLDYSFGRPRLDELLKPYAGTRTVVVVCGPPGLTQFVQAQAFAFGLDFHKETFIL